MPDEMPQHTTKITLPEEKSPVINIDEKPSGNALTRFIANNKILSGLGAVAIVAGCVAGGVYMTQPAQVEQVQFEDVVPPRPDTHGTQETIIKEKTIPGAGKGTITTVDHVQKKNVSAPYIGIDATGDPKQATLTVPEDIGKVGWYARSAPPGVDAGSTVMTSHINYAGITGYGSVFLDLKKGDPITVTTPDGKEWRYIVDSNTQIRKGTTAEEKAEYAKITSNTINKMDGPNFLVLVTCSGNFDPTSPLGYDQNTIVAAHLVR